MFTNRLVVMVVILAICLLTPSTLGLASPSQSETSYNPLIQSMLDQVDQAVVYTQVGNLSGEWPVTIDNQPFTLNTRHALSGEPNQKATQYLNQYYQSLGLDTAYQSFTFQGLQLSNVVAQKTGTVFPERIFMITSHFDDVPVTPPAPGADDNASGTVGVMLAASILNQYEFGCTLRFVNFNAEEYGMIGSKDYVQQSYCAGEDIRGVLNLDMVAWNSPQSAPEMDLHALSTIPESSAIANLFQEVVTAYGLQITPSLAEPIITGSDHFSFWRLGYPSILVTEDMDDFNPNYHSADDRLDTLQDFDYFTEMIKASLGTLAEMGCLVENGWGTVNGIVSDQINHLPIANASVSLANPEWGYTFTTRTDQNGSYQISGLQGMHTLSVDGNGYAAATYPGVMITHDKSLILDLELEPIYESIIYLPLSANLRNTPLPGCP
jgi:hypothetical protein